MTEEKKKPEKSVETDTPTVTELTQEHGHDQDREIQLLNISDEEKERLKAFSQLGFCSQCGCVGHMDVDPVKKKGVKTIRQVQGDVARGKTITMPCGGCREFAKTGRLTHDKKTITKAQSEKAEFIIIPREEMMPIIREGTYAGLDHTQLTMLMYSKLQARVYAGKLSYLDPSSPNYGKKSILEQL